MCKILPTEKHDNILVVKNNFSLTNPRWWSCQLHVIQIEDENKNPYVDSTMEHCVPKINKKYNCSGPLAFINQRVGYPSHQKLLHHY